MILQHKKFYKLLGLYFALFLISQLVIYLFAQNDFSVWDISVNMDKLIIYILIPLFLCGSSIIDQSITKTVVVRMGSRKKALRFEMKQQYLFAAIFFIAWTLLIFLFTAVLFDFSFLREDWLEVLNLYSRVFLGSCLLLNCAAILRKEKHFNIAMAAYPLAYLLLLLEVMAIRPAMEMVGQGMEVNLFFSWIFYDGALAFFVLAFWLSISCILLEHMATKEDIF